MRRTLADDVRELSRQLLQLHRKGLPRNPDDIVFQLPDIEFPAPITVRPVESKPLTEIAQVCRKCSAVIYRHISVDSFRRDMTLQNIVCNDCRRGDYVEPIHTGGF
jgi:hypothetical protein